MQFVDSWRSEAKRPLFLEFKSFLNSCSCKILGKSLKLVQTPRWWHWSAIFIRILCVFFFKFFSLWWELFLKNFYLFIYLFMAVLGLRFCARAFSSWGKWGPLFIAVRGPLTIAGSPVAEHRLQTRRLSNCGSRAQLLRGMWDLPRPGLEPVSPALAGRFSTTAPPGKPRILCF